MILVDFGVACSWIPLLCSLSFVYLLISQESLWLHAKGFHVPPSLLPRSRLNLKDDSQSKFEDLKSRGFVEGDERAWQNWHLHNQGQWPDIGSRWLPNITSLRPIVEMPVPRIPMKFWDHSRAIDQNVEHYAQHGEVWKKTVEHAGVHDNPQSNEPPIMFSPRWFPERDRLGLGYGDCRIFEGWDSWDSNFKLRVEEATDIHVLPQTGHLWQKFYIGPLPITMGWTLGSLIKVMAQSRCPGYAIVAVKAENMRKDTSIPGVREDLLQIALNVKDIAFESFTSDYEHIVNFQICGPTIITAGMVDWPEFVTLSNPEQYIATVVDNVNVSLKFKMEWGRGQWLSDLEGLYRSEEGANSVGLKRLIIPEVNDGFHPCSCSFGACKMVRNTVHKILGSRWDQDRQVCTDPKEQLVVEIWTDPSATPKQVLAFAINETLCWIDHMKKTLKSGVNTTGESDELHGMWKAIDQHRQIQSAQKKLGGPPISVLGLDSNGIIGETPVDQQIPTFPQISPPNPEISEDVWLLKNQDTTLNQTSKQTPETIRQHKQILLTDLKLPSMAMRSLKQRGLSLVEDLVKYTDNELLALPGIGPATLRFLRGHLAFTENLHKSASKSVTFPDGFKKKRNSKKFKMGV